MLVLACADLVVRIQREPNFVHVSTDDDFATYRWVVLRRQIWPVYKVDCFSVYVAVPTTRWLVENRLACI